MCVPENSGRSIEEDVKMFFKNIKLEVEVESEEVGLLFKNVM